MAWGDRPSRSPHGLALVVVLVCALPVSAGEADIARRLFAALDVAAEIERVAPVAIARLALLDEAPPADRALLREIIAAGFAAPHLEDLAFEALRARYDPAHARLAADWLARPEIRRLYAAGQTGSARCGGPRRVGAQRKRAMARILAATSVEARARSHAEDVLVTLLREANRVLPETRRRTREELTRIVADHRAARPALQAGWACAYREFSTDSLLAAQGFLESDAGRWLHASVSAAVGDALARAARATATRIVDHLGDPDPTRQPLRVVTRP